MAGGVRATMTAAVGGYLIGSIPVGVLLSRATRGIDVRDYGSGGSGTTNVLRIVGPGAALLTFGLDVGKGWAAGRAAAALGGDDAVAATASLAAAIGHCWPVLARFRGGKAVATALGGVLAVAPWAAPPSILCGSVVLAGTQIMSAGSLTAAATSIVVTGRRALAGGSPVPFAYCAAATALIAVRHQANIRRIVAGTEPRLSLPWSRTGRAAGTASR